MPYTKPPEIKPLRRRGELAGLTGLAAALALSGWLLSLGAIPGPAPESPSLAPTRTVTLAKADIDEILSSHVRYAVRQGAPVPLPAEIDPIILREIAEEKRDLYSVRILDSAADDGDIVTVLVDERSVAHVILTNPGSVLHLPVRRDGPTTLRFEAKQDGGGGVTFSAASSQGRTTTRVMAVGESEVWTVRLSP